MNKRLYYNNSYLRDFVAETVSSKKIEPGYEIILNQTAFYPTSGGQPNDWGTLNGQKILDVYEDSGENVVHLLSGILTDPEVRGVIDWDRRHDHMQQHTGQHILSQAFLQTSRLNTVSFHMGVDYATIDLDSDSITSAQLHLAEKLANQIVSENRRVISQIVPSQEVSGLGLRKDSQREGPLRIVTIEDFDVSACGGTHVNHTAEVGGIATRKTERVNRQIRVEFVCGNRIIKAHQSDLGIVTAIARQFSVGPEEAPERVERQLQENKHLRRKLQEKNRTLAALLAKELYRQAREQQGLKVVRQLFEDEEMEFLKLIAQALLAEGPCIALLGCRSGQQANLIFSQSETSPHDLREILAESCSLIEGKGGGVRNLAQGGGKRGSLLEEALSLAEQRITSSNQL